ncbi:MAG: Bax inhibitor-1/YccA family protein [Treponema sp.]|nr:Bax inhibitor-1/YccA family protein [Candidatus Treponema merdequi]
MNNYISLEQAQPEIQRKFIAGVYFKMVFALAITAAVAYFISIFFGTENIPAVFYENNLYPNIRYFLFKNIHTIMLVSVVAELAVVFVLSFNISNLSTLTAHILFILYSILTGISFASIFITFEIKSIFKVFAVSSLMFLGMSIYGAKTDSDLRSAGRYLFMGLIGIIIASLLNFFFRSSTMDWIICLVGVGIFVGLTAYDTQKILMMSKYADGTETYKKVEILGALELYLDFINIFLKLIRLFGKRK